MIGMIWTVKQNHAAVVERFGKFNKLTGEGICWKLPFFDKVKYLDWGDIANKGGWEIELSEQQINTEPRQVVSKDNIQVTADAVIYWRITDVKKAVYDVDHLPKALVETALVALRATIGKLDLDDLFQARGRINDHVRQNLAVIAAKYGVVIDRVEILELELADDTAIMMRQEAEAERQRRAQVSAAKAEAETLERVAKAKASARILEAKAEHQAVILKAEAEAKATSLMSAAHREYAEQLSKVLSSAEVSEMMIATKVLEGYEAMAKSGSSKVFLPNSFQGLMLDSSINKSVAP